ncbi:glycogen-binding subunit 76A isoform X2 [Plodia interpunctella]|uniref:glycogen-binding subunit 76A isoform X2 n=1 Tax=Plodia interpunctella TaxID=58824 RepID=UPI00236868F7|nr:glycogen-binding subunit 76A isoform X2 [Plodia interpunctella]
MTSPKLEMSLEHEIPVLMKKTQMNGDRAGSQCGLTSLLPMSCRGRAAAFARDLHSRLRNLGAPQDDDGESSWLTKENAAAHRPATSAQCDHDTFYDFEIECESPSSPVDEFDAPFPERNTNDDEPPFYDIDSDPDIKGQTKTMQTDQIKNGFTFSTAFYTESPIKHQPAPRENGHADKRLFSAITFEGCARQNSLDEVDNATMSPVMDMDRLSLPNLTSVTLDSDSEFESAKSEPSDIVDEVFQNDRLENDLTDCIENLSFAEAEVTNEENLIVTNNNDENCTEDNKETNGLEIITSEVLNEKETSPVPEIEPSLLSAEINIEDNEDIEDYRPQRVRRCSSLKTGKTPPGTPGRKKIVRFADVLGLDLADVKTFMDEIPVIPTSAYDDLTGCDVASSPPVRPQPRLGSLTLVPLFQLPRDVTEKLELQNVCLESARVCDGVHVTVCGSVRVRNLDFHKTVHIRYTMNRWKTYTDLQATYVQGSCDGYSDRFQYVLYAPAITSGQRLEIAVRFQCKGQQFWDNNSGANYCFDCLALGMNTVIQQSPPGPLHPIVDWHPSFY